MTPGESNLLRSREHKSIKIIATCKLITDQLARSLVRQEPAAEPLDNQSAWGTSKNDQTLRGL
jgi:hypothetical protein